MRKQDLILLIVSLLISSVSAVTRDCSVTQTVKFSDCVSYCWDTYKGSKDFYDFNSGLCQERITCGPGYYNDYVNNICIDEFGGYVLKELGFIISAKDTRVRFAQIQVIKGYFVSHKIICDDGWKSSMRTQIRNEMSIIVYLCDEQLKDGEIYPKTHGEYFFEQLSDNQKISAIDSVFGPDSLSTIMTLKIIVVLTFTCAFWILNIIACCTLIGKKAKPKICCFTKSKSQKNDKLTESQNLEVQNFLEKRKQSNMKAFGQMKEFCIKGQIQGQLDLMKKIKDDSHEIMKKKWEKRLQKKQEDKKKQEEKQNQKQVKQKSFKKQKKSPTKQKNVQQKKYKKEDKPLEIFRFLKDSKTKSEQENKPLESKIKPSETKLDTSGKIRSSDKMKNSLVLQSIKSKQNSKNSLKH